MSFEKPIDPISYASSVCNFLFQFNWWIIVFRGNSHRRQENLISVLAVLLRATLIQLIPIRWPRRKNVSEPVKPSTLTRQLWYPIPFPSFSLPRIYFVLSSSTSSRLNVATKETGLLSVKPGAAIGRWNASINCYREFRDLNSSRRRPDHSLIERIYVARDKPGRMLHRHFTACPLCNIVATGCGDWGYIAGKVGTLESGDSRERYSRRGIKDDYRTRRFRNWKKKVSRIRSYSTLN